MFLFDATTGPLMMLVVLLSMCFLRAAGTRSSVGFVDSFRGLVRSKAWKELWGSQRSDSAPSSMNCCYLEPCTADLALYRQRLMERPCYRS